jgi:hypothetical protein
MKTSYHFNRNTVKQSSLTAPNKRMTMVSGFSVQVSAFWPLVSRFWLLANNQ